MFEYSKGENSSINIIVRQSIFIRAQLLLAHFQASTFNLELLPKSVSFVPSNEKYYSSFYEIYYYLG